jgi:hypothetical protein
MAEESVLIKIEVEKGQGEQQVDNMTKKIIDLSNANKDLIKQNKELEKSGQQNSQQYIENTRQIEINKQKITEATASRKGLIQSLIAEDDSIKGLKIRNAELIKQRDQLSTSTALGRSKIAEINQELDRNNKAIVANSSALEKQKFNIGNYKSALDGIVPGMGGFISGIEGATKASLAFIATPIGAVIGALGLAVAALTVYFKGSEEGQDRLTKITTILGVVMNKLMLVVEDIGEALFNGAEGFGTLTEKMGIFGAALDLSLAPLKLLLLGLEKIGELTGFDKVVDDAVKAGAAIADLNDKIEARENELIVKRAETNAKVQALREQAIKQEGELKATTIKEAIRLEKELAEAEKQQHIDRLKAFDLEAATTGKLTEEQKKKRAELQAAVINAEAEGAQATIKFQKEIERLKDEAAGKQAKSQDDAAKKAAKSAADAAAEAAKVAEAAKKKQEEESAAIEKSTENKIKAERELTEVIKGEEVARAATAEERRQKEIELQQLKFQNLTADLDAEAELIESKGIEANAVELARLAELEAQKALLTEESEAAIAAIKKKYADQQSTAEKKKADEQIARVKALKASEAGEAINLSNTLSNLSKRDSAEQKAFALTSIGISSGVGVANAVKAGSGIPWPGNLAAILSGIAAVLAGIGQAKNLLGFIKGGLIPGYADGGVLSGTRIMPHHGSPIFRSNGDNRLVTAKTGEVILNERHQAMLGGPAVFRSIGVPGFASSGIVSNSATNAASNQAQSQSVIQDTIRSVMSSMPPIIVTVEDINARTDEVNFATQKAQVI